MIKAVLFDVGGVLEIVDDQWPDAWLEHVADIAGLSSDDVVLRLQMAELPDTSIADGTEGLYMAEFGRALGLTPQQTQAVFDDMWDRYCGELNQPMVDFARSLQGRYTLGILSNSADGAHREEEARYGFSRVFDHIMYSHKVGMEKPDPRFFAYACQQLDVAPAHVLFLDDHADNVDAAREFGLHAIHVADTQEAIALASAVLSSDDVDPDAVDTIGLDRSLLPPTQGKRR